MSCQIRCHHWFPVILLSPVSENSDNQPTGYGDTDLFPVYRVVTLVAGDVISGPMTSFISYCRLYKMV